EGPEDVVLVLVVGQPDAELVEPAGQPPPGLLAREVRAVGGDDEAKGPPLRAQGRREPLQLRVGDLVPAIEQAGVDLFRDPQQRIWGVARVSLEEDEVVVALAQDGGPGLARDHAAEAQLGQRHPGQPRRAADDPRPPARMRSADRVPACGWRMRNHAGRRASAWS